MSRSAAPKAHGTAARSPQGGGYPMGRLNDPFAQPSFGNPWSLRVFAVTLAAAEAGVFSLQEFQQALIAQIRTFEETGRCIDSDETYYTRWAEALTALLASRQLLASALSPAEQAVRDALKALQHRHPHDQDDGDDHHGPGHQHQRPQPRPLFVEPAR